jgi:membrane associated rhomboid family serine protease
VIVVLHRRVTPVIAALIAIALVTSLVAGIDRHLGGALYFRLALIPDRVWHGELWRLVTWPFVYTNPWLLTLGMFELWVFGGALAESWSQARLARFAILVIVVAGVGTCVLAWVFPAGWHWPQFAGFALSNAIAIAFGLQYPLARVQVYAVIDISGDVLAYGTLGFTVMLALFYGVSWALPELLAGGAAFVYMTRPDRPWWHKLRKYRTRRRFGVMDGDHHGGPYYPN